MHLKKTFLLIFSVGFVYCFSLFGQHRIMTYEETINYAVENNIRLKQQENQLLRSKYQKQQNYANFFPDANLNLTGAITAGRRFDNSSGQILTNTSEDMSASLIINYQIFNGFRRLSSLKQSQLAFLSQQYRLEQTKKDIIYNTTLQFLQVLMDKELVKIAEQNIKSQDQLLRQITECVKLGSRPLSDQLTQDAQVKQLNIQLALVKNQLSNDLAVLAQSIGFNVGESMDIAPPMRTIELEELRNYSIDSLHNLALNNRCDYKQLYTDMQSSKYIYKSSFGLYSPTVGIFYAHNSNYSSALTNNDIVIPLEQQLRSSNFNDVFGINIIIPIFNNLSTRAAIKQSKLAYTDAQYDIVEMEKTIYQEVTIAYNNYKLSAETYEASLSSLEASQTSLEQQKMRFDLGEASIVELSLENQRYMTALANKIQAEYTLMFQDVMIDYFIGKL